MAVEKAPMKILILTERFYPEEFLINDLAAEWKRQGYDVEVLTQVPSYPYDHIYQNYKNNLCQTTHEFHGIPIHRIRTVLGYNSSVKRKILNYISFALLTSIWALLNGWRYQRVFAFHSGPLTMAFAGLVLRFVWWRKCMIWTQDVWPDTVYNYGIKPSWAMRKCLGALVWFIYKAYSSISVSCPGFIDRLKPYVKRKVLFFPQWTASSYCCPTRDRQETVVFTFAGNIGSVQNLDVLLVTFGNLRLPNAILRIVGDGVFLNKLKGIVEKNHFMNIEFTGRLPSDHMPEIFAASDVLIISLKPEFDLTIPAKFQAYIAAGRPILGIVRGDTASLIQKYNLGVTADPAQPTEIAKAIEKFMHSNNDQFNAWQANARKLSRTLFDRDKIITDMTNSLIGY